jgi:hypothetical protein
MPEDTYGGELQQTVSVLTQAGCRASVRGEGTSRFVFAEHNDRAVEMSRDGADVYIEFWRPGEDSSSTDGRELNYEAAIQRAFAWLRQT